MPIKDISNIRFGFLIALRYVPQKGSDGAIWECVCDCGNSCKVNSHALRRGKTKSCGCKKGHLVSLSLRKEPGESNRRQLYNTYRNQAKIRSYMFDLSFEEFVNLISQNCFYCNKSPQQQIVKSSIDGEYILLYNGIDRINNDFGYQADNVIAACGQCNIAKKNYSFNEFVDWINRVTKNLSERKII